MGSPKLLQFLRENAADALTTMPVLELGTLFAGQFVAIDANLYIHKWENTPLGAIKGVTFQFMRFMKMGIIPVYVFDGKRPQTKVVNYNTLVNVDIKSVANYLNEIGILTQQSIEEADSQCARYDVCVTTDLDVIGFGAKKVIVINATMATIIDVSKALEILELTRDQFIEVMIIVGTDYTIRSPPLGYGRAISFVKDGGKLDQFNGIYGFEYENALHNFHNQQTLAPITRAKMRLKMSKKIPERAVSQMEAVIFEYNSQLSK